MFDTTKRKPDYPLLTVVGILVPLGLVMVYSSSFVDAFTNHNSQLYYTWRQIDAARKRGHQTGVSPKRFSILRLVTAFRDSLAPQRRSIADAAPPAVAENQVLPILVQESRLSPVARSDTCQKPVSPGFTR